MYKQTIGLRMLVLHVDGRVDAYKSKFFPKQYFV